MRESPAETGRLDRYDIELLQNWGVRYLDILEDVVRGYNNRVNSNTGVAPDDVEDITPDQRQDVF